jgi:hypothetical protein
MKTALNNKIRKIVGNGNYVSKEYNKQPQLKDSDYYYNITTVDSMFNFYHIGGEIKLPLKDVEWRIFWDKLGDVPTDEEDCIENSFEHFETGTDREDIWSWFEWFFDIDLGKGIYK